MTCDMATSRLGDMVDGELAARERTELLAHLEDCPSCREELDQLRALLAAARELPREREPDRDLWPGVARRLEERAAPRVGFGPRWSLLAAAAAVLLALSSFWLQGIREAVPPAPVAAGLRHEVRPASFSVGDVLRSEREYARATAVLMAAVEERSDGLSPETREVVSKNLAAIDAALADIRRAIEADPGNEELAGLFRATHRRKVDVLQTVVRLTQS
jgi:predicted anti-sigma-YlaC factor YlaD